METSVTKSKIWYFLNPWPDSSFFIVTIFKEDFRRLQRIKANREWKKCVRCIWVEGRWEVAIVYSWECDILGRPRVSPLCPSITAQYTAYIHYKLHTAQFTLHVEHCNIAMLGQTALFVFNHHWVHALQIGDYTDVEQIQSTLPFSQFKRTGRHSVQHNSYICTEVYCPLDTVHWTVSSVVSLHCSEYYTVCTALF